MTSTQIAIYGAGPFARELAWLISRCNDAGARYELVAFVERADRIEHDALHGVRVVTADALRAECPGARVVMAVNDGALRARLVEEARALGFEFETLVDPSVLCSSRVELGEGTILCAGTIVTTDVRIGRHVIVNIQCSIAHDVVLGDFVTLAPGVHLSGNVHVGDGTFVGSGAVVRQGVPHDPLVIGEGATVGAGSVVLRSVPPRATVFGVPARRLPSLPD